ncbi:MAG: RNA-guided endonuclease InsQ/TnpB family protein [Cyanophyceae cyanobacterium]
MLTRRVTYRLYPSRSQANKLHWARKAHCDLYNAAIANRRTQYKRFDHSVDYREQQNSLPAFKDVWSEYKEFGGHALQATLKRVDFAYQRFFNGLGGYPKFKAKRFYRGWTYPCKQSWKAHTSGVNGKLELRDLGLKLKMRGQARTWGTSSTCTIFFHQGKWYVSITVKCLPDRNTGSGAVGIDLGCKDAVTLSTQEKIAKPEFIKEGQRQVKAASKRLRRKRAPKRNKKSAEYDCPSECGNRVPARGAVKASRRWKRKRAKVSQLQRKVARQREDWLHQLTSSIVSANSLVAGEQLNVKGMTRKGKRQCKRGLNRSILEVGFGTIGGLLDYKLKEANGVYLESPTRTLKPTQRCLKCWELTPKSLSDRVHVCQHCQHTEDRDVNAAQVNLAWARGQELSSLAVESPSSTSGGSMKQLGMLKRQKPRPQPSGRAG